MSDVQHSCKVPQTWPNIHSKPRSASATATLATAFLSPDITKDVIPFRDEDDHTDNINSWGKVAAVLSAVLAYVQTLEAREDEEAAR